MSRRPTTGLGRLFDAPAAQTVEDELAGAWRDASAEQGIQLEGTRPFLEWAKDVPEPKRPLDLERFRFQRELYSQAGELDHAIDVKKAAQLGVSAWLIRWAFRRADIGNTVLYVMPRERQATEFSTMRVRPVLSASSYLRARQRVGEDASDTKRLKSIGVGYLAIRGSKSEDELVSVDADALALDEYDRLAQANLPRVEQRITSAFSAGLMRCVSTPTIPNFGIDKRFQATDQRYWHVKCSCGRWTPMKGMQTFLEVLDKDTATLLCPDEDCRRPLDVRQGEWVADVLDGDRSRGYSMPKFVVPGIDLQAIITRSEKTSETEQRAFHNEDLGEAWQSATAGLTDEQIAAAVRPYRMERERYLGFNLVTMGVDVAASRALNVRISEHIDEHTKRALWIGEVDNGRAPWGAMAGMSAFEILSEIMERFRVRVAVIDHMPDPRLVRGWCERHYGRAFRVSWSENAGSILRFQDPKEDPTKLTARYLEGIDVTLDLIRRQANLLPQDRPEGYDAHLKARTLLTVEDIEPNSKTQNVTKPGDVKQQWVRTGADDYLQAEAYDVIATHMAYVQQAQGAIAADGEIVPGRPDVVDMEQAWQDGPDGYSDGPDEEPMSGWE